MTTIRELTAPGAYDYEYRVSLVKSRRGRPYMVVSGFSWGLNGPGNSGGRVTTQTPLTEAGEAELISLMDLTEETRENGGLFCTSATHATDANEVGLCPRCSPWTLHDIAQQMEDREELFAGKARIVS